MIYLNLGRREQGKTTLARYLASKMPRRVYLDPRGMIPSSAPVGTTGDDWWSFLDGVIPEMVCRPAGDLQTFVDRAGFLTADFIQRSPKAETASFAIVIDEAGLVDLAEWDWVFRCASRERIHLILTAHRPVDISTRIRAIADYWCVFRTVQSNDLERLEERCGENFTDHARVLEPKCFLLWDDTKGEWKHFDRPSDWYLPPAVPFSIERPSSPLADLQSAPKRGQGDLL